jgi:hypothetical protein
LKALLSPHYEDSKLETYLEKQVKTEGLVSKKPLERLVDFKRIHRPFRRIVFNLSDAISDSIRTCESLIDEEAAPYVMDSSHRLLLWRPRISKIEVEGENESEEDPSQSEAVRTAIDDLILTRWEGQELDDEVRPKLRSLQADPLAAIALIIPRKPGSLRREEEMLADTRESHAFVVASCMVTNSSPKDVIQSYQLRERVLSETIVAKYESISESSERYLFLEAPGTKSPEQAKKAGAALTRISNLYIEFLSALKRSYRI